MYLRLNKAFSCILCLGRDIYYAKYYGRGEGWLLGEKLVEKMTKWKKITENCILHSYELKKFPPPPPLNETNIKR